MFVLLLILRQIKPALWKVHFRKLSFLQFGVAEHRYAKHGITAQPHHLSLKEAAPLPCANDRGAYVEDSE